jgi:AbrB family looped-hinge helix DNA binding protein
MKTKMTRKGQITIPAGLRRELGLQQGDIVEVKRSSSKDKPELRILPTSNLENLMGIAKSAKKFNRQAVQEALEAERRRQWQGKTKQT